MSYDAVHDVIPYFFLGKTKPPMKLEDVYTGFLALNAGVPSFAADSMFRHSNNGECEYNGRAVSAHFWQRSRTDEVACMKKNFDEMLKNNVDDAFTRLHYVH